MEEVNFEEVWDELESRKLSRNNQLQNIRE